MSKKPIESTRQKILRHHDFGEWNEGMERLATIRESILAKPPSRETRGYEKRVVLDEFDPLKYLDLADSGNVPNRTKSLQECLKGIRKWLSYEKDTQVSDVLKAAETMAFLYHYFYRLEDWFDMPNDVLRAINQLGSLLKRVPQDIERYPRIIHGVETRFAKIQSDKLAQDQLGQEHSQKIETVRNELKALQPIVKNNETTLSTQSERTSGLQEEVSDLKRTTKTWNDTLTEYAKQFESIEKKALNHANLAQKHSQEFEEIRGEIQSLKPMIETIETVLSEQSEATTGLEEEALALKEMVNEWTNTLVEHAEQFERIDEEALTLKEKVDSWINTLVEHTQQLERMDEEALTLEQTVEEWASTLEEHIKQLERFDETKQDFQNNNEQIQQQFQEAKQEFQNNDEKLQQRFQEAKQEFQKNAKWFQQRFLGLIGVGILLLVTFSGMGWYLFQSQESNLAQQTREAQSLIREVDERMESKILELRQTNEAFEKYRNDLKTEAEALATLKKNLETLKKELKPLSEIGNLSERNMRIVKQLQADAEEREKTDILFQKSLERLLQKLTEATDKIDEKPN